MTTPRQTRAAPDPGRFGMNVLGDLFPTPQSKGLEALEHSLGGGGLLTDDGGRPLALKPQVNAPRDLFEATVKDNPPPKMTLLAANGKRRVLTGAAVSPQTSFLRAQVIPGDVIASYMMTDYYYSTEGDVRELVRMPMEVALRPIEVQHEDAGVRDFTEEMLGPDYLDIDKLIPDLWLSRHLYGVAYPYEVWSGRVPDRTTLNAIARGEKTPPKGLYPQAVSALNPRFIYVGESFFSGTGQLYVSPQGDAGAELRRQIMDRELPPMSYNAFSSDVHEFLQWGWNIPLEPSTCTQIRDHTVNSWVRYPWTPFLASFRTLSTRQILEEMIRATIEGTKNQLWAFLLGDPKGEKRPTKDEIAALQGTVAGLTGRRTGNLVWGGHLRIEVFAPKFESAMANDKWAELTEHLLHQQGISRLLLSGPSKDIMEPPKSTESISVQVFTQRMNARRDSLHRYLRSLVRKIFLLSGDQALVKRALANKLPVVTMGEFGMRQQEMIANYVMPLYTPGLMSPQTAMRKAGLDYDSEIANHQKADKEQLAPPAVFAQAVVSQENEEAQDSKTTAPAKRTTKTQTGTNGTRKTA